MVDVPEQPAPSTRDRLVTAVLYVATPLMVLAQLDPLEGAFLVGLLGLLVAWAAFVLRHRARWLVVTGLVLLVLTFGLMGVAAQLGPNRQDVGLLLAPWLGAQLLIIAGSIWALHTRLTQGHPRAARLVTAGLILLGLLLEARVFILISRYRG